MQRKERKLLIEPIRKDNLQTSILNQRFDSKFQELRNTITREAERVKSRNIVARCTLVVAGGPGANDELYDDEYVHRIIGLASRSRRWRLSVPERSYSQPLDCLTAKGRSPIGPIATSFRGNILPS
jgi:hypothetical protein